MITSPAKRCVHCGETKPAGDFYFRSDNGQLSSWCRKCSYEGNKARRGRGGKVYNPDVDIWSHRQRKYGLSRETFEEMLAEQDGRCAICRREPNGKGICVDHDHETGQIRGLLCASCNWALGHMHDNPDWLNNAITYLHHGFTGDEHAVS